VNELLAIVLGFFAGALGGLMGIGGGILFVPALALFLDQSHLEAEATSLVAIIPVAVVGTWRQLSYGNVRLRDGLAIGLLSPLGVVAGVVISNTVSERVLQIGFACLVLVFAAQLVRRALYPPDSAPDSNSS
jgi:uncharacterized membrane protein YfcA